MLSVRFTPPSASIRLFSVEYCTAGKLPDQRSVSDPAVVLHALYHELERRKQVLGRRRTQKDPFEGEWEQILSWLIANPERSSGDIFRELQRLSQDAISPCKFALFSVGCGKYELTRLGNL